MCVCLYVGVCVCRGWGCGGVGKHNLMSTEEDFRMNYMVILEKRKRGGATRTEVDRSGLWSESVFHLQCVFQALKRSGK